MKLFWILSLGVIVVLVAAFLMPAPSPSQELTAPERQLIETWLLDNCPLDERQNLITSLREISAKAAPAFIAAFEQGPPERLVTELQDAAVRRFEQRAQLLEANEDVGLDEEALSEARSQPRERFLERARADFADRYKSQALNGLGIVGGPEAEELLKRVASDETSALRQAAQEALRSAAESGPG